MRTWTRAKFIPASLLLISMVLPTLSHGQTTHFFQRPRTDLEKQAWALCDRKYGAVFAVRILMEEKKVICKVSPDEIGFSHKNWSGTAPKGASPKDRLPAPVATPRKKEARKVEVRPRNNAWKHRSVEPAGTTAQKAYCNKSGPYVWDPYTCPR